MSLEYIIDEEQDTIFIWGSGVMDRDSVMAYLQRAYNNEKLQPGVNSYVDVSHVEKIDISIQAARDLVGLIAENRDRRGDAKSALVSTFDLNFGLLRMFSARTDMDRASVTWGVFSDPQKALEWLGIDHLPDCFGS
jgi:hypothetical protein